MNDLANIEFVELMHQSNGTTIARRTTNIILKGPRMKADTYKEFEKINRRQLVILGLVIAIAQKLDDSDEIKALVADAKLHATELQTSLAAAKAANPTP